MRWGRGVCCIPCTFGDGAEGREAGVLHQHDGVPAFAVWGGKRGGDTSQIQNLDAGDAFRRRDPVERRSVPLQIGFLPGTRREVGIVVVLGVFVVAH